MKRWLLICARSIVVLVACVASPPGFAQHSSHTKADVPRPMRAASSMAPGDGFKDCTECPEMVVIRAGSFTMGSQPDDLHGEADERPAHEVTFKADFAIGRYPVSFNEWDACVAAGGCRGHKPSDYAWGRGRQPAIDVSWDDANAYVSWLSRRTGTVYRLLSEAEREYVTRAGTSTPYWWGLLASAARANYNANATIPGDTLGARPVAVGSFAPNPWGIFDVHGNIYEWVQDCWNDTYVGAPADGSAWLTGNCDARVLRGGSWNRPANAMRAQARLLANPERRMNRIGFRVARSLQPQR